MITVVEDLNDFDKSQIVMSRRLGWSLSEIPRPEGFSWSAVMSTYWHWSKEGQITNWRRSVEWQGSSMCGGNKVCCISPLLHCNAINELAKTFQCHKASKKHSKVSHPTTQRCPLNDISPISHEQNTAGLNSIQLNTELVPWCLVNLLIERGIWAERQDRNAISDKSNEFQVMKCHNFILPTNIKEKTCHDYVFYHHDNNDPATPSG